MDNARDGSAQRREPEAQNASANRQSFADNTARKQRGRPFVPGQSGNPGGRPPGSRNKMTLLAEQMLADKAEDLFTYLIGYAIAGNNTAMRLCIERMVPRVRERPIQFNLPELKSLDDASHALAAIAEGIRQGEVSESEAVVLLRLVQQFRECLDAQTKNPSSPSGDDSDDDIIEII